MLEGLPSRRRSRSSLERTTPKPSHRRYKPSGEGIAQLLQTSKSRVHDSPREILQMSHKEITTLRPPWIADQRAGGQSESQAA